jgi:hypothetical protein
MSRERELLKRVYDSLGEWIPAKLKNEIKEELAKPDPECAGVAGIARLSPDGDHYYIEPRGNVCLPEGTMVYAELPKREPLSDDDI